MERVSAGTPLHPAQPGSDPVAIGRSPCCFLAGVLLALAGTTPNRGPARAIARTSKAAVSVVLAPERGAQ
jgi:hypothetical protein